MAAGSMGPYRAQDPAEVWIMVDALEKHQGRSTSKGGFSCRKNVFPVAGSDIKVSSWKMSEWDYKKPQLPTYSRGLFTYKDSRGEHVIAVRGYDKFFNHGEVHKTEWRNVEKNTRGPYELSVKENGCIIFMAGLEDDTLLVCSKHSTGNREDVDVSHAAVGERWADKHLATVGKTRKEFARHLRERNITAVAELCDDDFEEHVLAYKPEMAGLYLHGINLNLPEFATWPAPFVDKFAEEWGFRKTMHLTMDNIATVKKFLDETAETGSYAGRATEGFVIRCQAREIEDGPYVDWFFKYKFEEPYLMYRQWRECTKALISGKEPKVKKHNKITFLYLEYAKRRLREDKTLADAYQHNHGIIKMREDFLKEYNLTGEDVIKEADKALRRADENVNGDVVLVPVATIGCGKTTLALALVKLFNWGHVQNDNIQGKARPPRFARMICDELRKSPVVIADRNNHLKSERKQVIEDVARPMPMTKFVALNYRHKYGNDEAIREKTRQRVFSRGDNHQTIQATSKGPDFILDIMEGFMQRFQPIDDESAPDDQFDAIIDLDATAESRQNLEKVINSLEQQYPSLFKGDLPTSQDLDDAIAWALQEYRPDIKHVVNADYHNNQKAKKENKQQPNGNANGNQKKPKPAKIEFFGIYPSYARVLSTLEQAFANLADEKAAFYRKLKATNRIQSEFHVTLIHRAAQSQNAAYWDQLTRLYDQAGPTESDKQPVIGQVNVVLDRIVWDGRCMAIKVVLRSMQQQQDLFFRSVNVVAHITVGTADQSIKPKESNDMLGRWWNDQLQGLQEIRVQEHTEIVGDVKAVLQKF